MKLPRRTLPVIVFLLVVAVSAAVWIGFGGWHGLRESALAQAVKAEIEPARRDSWQMPDKVIEALKIREGEKIADIGAGRGYFAKRFAQAVGPNGRVYAVDIDASSVDWMEREAKDLGLSSYKPRLAKADDPGLTSPVDLIFICDTYHHIRSAEYLKRIATAVKPTGRVAIIDFKKDPKIEAEEKYEGRISREQVLEDFHRAGYTLEQEYHFLPKQYFMIFSPPGARQIVK